MSSNIFIDMALRGSNQQTLLASGQIHGSDGGTAVGLIRSNDAGQSWSVVNPSGVAVVNGNADAANVTIELFNAEGEQVGRGMRTIAGNGRISQLLSQIDPLLPAMTRGYFKVVADRPVLSYSVFGTNTLSVLAAGRRWAEFVSFRVFLGGPDSPL